MGWVTLSLRKLTLRTQINDFELQDITLSRQLRTTQRHRAYDKSRLEASKKSEITEAKKAYTKAREDRPEVTSEEYAEWQANYAAAKEEYEAQKLDIDDYYDGLMEDIEEEATDEENRIQEEQTTLEAELEAVRQELEAVNEQISSDIQSSKISLK